MLHPIKVVDIELTQPLPAVDGLEGYFGVRAILRLRAVPVAYLDCPVVGGRCDPGLLARRILDNRVWEILTALVREGLLADPVPPRFDVDALLDLPSASDRFWRDHVGEAPVVTVAVCTRDRASDLAICLDALQALDYPALDVLVVDNAPSNEETATLVATRFPSVRYVREPRPGLDWARNRAILEAHGEIIAYTDDDVVVDPGWVKALARAFMEHSEVMGVTGLVVPFELETEAQVLFEHYGGFGRGFERKWWRVPSGRPVPWRWLGAGQFGTGANMAFRRRLFEEVGDFDTALDVGTVTRGGGDLEMFFRVLKAGHTLMYEPEAMIRHRHRSDYARLRIQIASNGSLYALWSSIFRRYPDQRGACLRIGAWWMWHWNLRRWLGSYRYPNRFPRDLVAAELKGGLAGLRSYSRAVRDTQAIERDFGPQVPGVMAHPRVVPSTKTTTTVSRTRVPSLAVRKVELSRPLTPQRDLAEHDGARLFATWSDRPVGTVTIRNRGPELNRTRQADGLARALAAQLIGPDPSLEKGFRWSLALASLAFRLGGTAPEARSSLPREIDVSVVLATYDRPDDLRNCLQALRLQRTPRRLEVLVVDNHPESGITGPVVAEFPDVVLVQEPRQGLAYARNAGFLAASGAILVATDDDVTMPPDWLEKLLAPFSRPDVMVVTGQVLPLELMTSSQQAFEDYGGLGRGYVHFERSGAWFEKTRRAPVRTWTLGATANAAFRASIFADPRIGLMEETLGPGMPSGVGEDTYLFYKVLKADFTVTYTPDAYVWHKHRRDDAALRRQLFNYSKGHVAYHLTTLLKDGDWRGLRWVLWGLPKAQLRRLIMSAIGKSPYPFGLVLLEIRGNLAGPWALWQSYRRVWREGRSAATAPGISGGVECCGGSGLAAPDRVG